MTKTPLELWLDKVNLLRAKAERLDEESKAAWVEYDKALNDYPRKQEEPEGTAVSLTLNPLGKAMLAEFRKDPRNA